MKHSCCLQIHPEILLKYRERCADGMPLATETALTGDCPRASHAIEDNLCHLGAHEGGVYPVHVRSCHRSAVERVDQTLSPR